MRLGQLARKLSLRPSQIVEFLAQNNIAIEDNSNTRLEDHHVETIVRHFAPDSIEQIIAETEEPEIKPAAEIVVDSQPEITEVVAPEAEQTEPSVDPLPEIIRVQKIELSGLKVLGKIELPEPKKKEPAAEQNQEGSEQTTTEKPLPDRRRPKRETRERSHHRTSRNPLELQREREARQREEKRRIEAEREKEKRKRHYEEKRKSQAQTKRAKPLKAQPTAARKADNRPVPKTWFGKFLRWWTT